MERFFFSLRKAGLWDVYTRYRDPSSRIGVVARMRGMPHNRPWVFLPLRHFARKYPVTGIFRESKRVFAVDAYLSESKQQQCDAWWDSRVEVRQ